LISDNGISGTWSPDVISNQLGGSYVFTPEDGQCALPITIEIAITPLVTPDFSIVTDYCQNASIPILPLISDNGISGTWFPDVISNQVGGSYLFTPDAGQCATSVDLHVNISPVGTFEEDILLCQSDSGIEVETLFTQLSENTYVFEWFLNNQLLSHESSTLQVNTPGLYQTIATSINTGCQLIYTFQVMLLSVVDVQINTGEDFSHYPFVEVIVNGGSGSFLFSFDNGPFQSNPSFSPLGLIDIPILVVDSNGCFSELYNVTLWNYPKFFTPNGDGYNDTWGIKTQKEVFIEVFDRYGRLITTLRNNETWDGTLNDMPLPATDYWFVIYYEQKTFKSHFSLKR